MSFWDIVDHLFDCAVALAIGLGMGAYNSEVLKPCMEDTFHVSHKKSKEAVDKAAPYVQKAYDNAGPMARDLYVKSADAAKKGHAAATPYVQKAYENAGPMARDLYVKSADAAKKGHAAAMPYVKHVSNKAVEGAKSIKASYGMPKPAAAPPVASPPPAAPAAEPPVSNDTSTWW